MIKAWCLSPRGGFSWLLEAPLWLLVPPSGGPCWIPNATLVLLYCHSTATFTPLHSNSIALLLPLYDHSTVPLFCHSTYHSTVPPLCHSTTTPLLPYCHSFATLLPFFCHCIATLLPLYCHSWATPLALFCHSPATWDHGSPNLPQPTPGPAGPDATPKIYKFPSHTLLVQRQPNTLEAVWEKRTTKRITPIALSPS